MMTTKLMQPLRLGKMTLKNRMVLPPMGTDFAMAGKHEVTPAFIAYMEERARGGAGLLINEYVAVSPSGLASPRQLGLWDDEFIPGFCDLVQAVHRHDAALVVQLHHAGRETSRAITGQMPLAPSAVPSPRKGGEVRALGREEIPELVRDFARAAGRARRAGCDGVELHGAHGYLMAGFMSPHGNRRSDEYGGDLQGYLRFPLEVLAAVREAVGPDFIIGFRISSDEFVAGGRTLPETVEMARCLAEAGVDYLHVSAGTSASLHTIIAPGAYPLGWNVQAAATVKQAVSIPVIAVGRIHEPQLAEEVIATNKADLVALGRALLADADFPRHTTQGRPETIRRCLGCLGGCMEEPVACTQNPRLGREPSVSKEARHPRRVLVIGGGVAGLEAARVAAQRGHQVSLWEEQPDLGGQVRLACRPPHKERLVEAVCFRVRALEAAGVEIKTSMRADVPTVIDHQPDVVIVATGAEPAVDRGPWDGEVPVFTHADALSTLPSGKRLAVVGGGMIGLETAEYLSAKGKQVVVLEEGAVLAGDMPQTASRLLLSRLEKAGVGLVKNVTWQRVEARQLEVEVAGEFWKYALDAVITARRRQSVNLLAKELQSLVGELYVIGDARKPRRLREAIWDGDEAARRI